MSRDGESGQDERLEEHDGGEVFKWSASLVDGGRWEQSSESEHWIPFGDLI